MSKTPKPTDEAKKKFHPSNWDASVIIALIAVLISSATALISLKESGILLEQQQMLTAQQEASVWPYLESRRIHSVSSDTSVIYQFTIVNKGVGPAIIDSVKYVFDGQEITGWGLEDALQEAYPQYKIIQANNSTLDGKVMAPGETHVIITEKIIKAKTDTTNLMDFLNEFDFHLEYCYCSVYGKCWKVSSLFDIKPSEECSFRSDIR